MSEPNTLLNTLRAYPGGVVKLAEDCGFTRYTIYKIARGQNVMLPAEAINAVVEACRGKTLLGVRVTADWIMAEWKKARTEYMTRPAPRASSTRVAPKRRSLREARH